MNYSSALCLVIVKLFTERPIAVVQTLYHANDDSRKETAKGVA